MPAYVGIRAKYINRAASSIAARQRHVDGYEIESLWLYFAGSRPAILPPMDHKPQFKGALKSRHLDATALATIKRQRQRGLSKNPYCDNVWESWKVAARS